MNVNKLSNLEPVDLRDVWASESRNFTPWLAQEDNLSTLSKAIKMDLQLEGMELPVGPFRADILCTDRMLDTRVLIENQLEMTDHCHLGQILTYAAGLKASCIIWISKRFTDEHRAVLDWLNENTGDNTHFFGIEMQLWKIGDSSPAPLFNVIVQPNEWSNKIEQTTKRIKSEGFSDTQTFQLSYWTALLQTLKGLNGRAPPKPQPLHYLRFTTGKTDVQISVTICIREKHIGVEVYFSGDTAKENYARLFLEKGQIEAEIGSSLDWQELPDKIASRILLKHTNVNIEDTEQWQDQHQWIRNMLDRFQKVFLPRIRALELPIDALT